MRGPDQLPGALSFDETQQMASPYYSADPPLVSAYVGFSQYHTAFLMALADDLQCGKCRHLAQGAWNFESGFEVVATAWR